MHRIWDIGEVEYDRTLIKTSYLNNMM